MTQTPATRTQEIKVIQNRLKAGTNQPNDVDRLMRLRNSAEDRFMLAAKTDRQRRVGQWTHMTVENGRIVFHYPDGSTKGRA